MAKTILFSGISTTTSLPDSYQSGDNSAGAPLRSIQISGDALTFVTWGIGTGTWSGTLKLGRINIRKL